MLTVFAASTCLDPFGGPALRDDDRRYGYLDLARAHIQKTKSDRVDTRESTCNVMFSRLVTLITVPRLNRKMITYNFKGVNIVANEGNVALSGLHAENYATVPIQWLRCDLWVGILMPLMVRWE